MMNSIQCICPPGYYGEETMVNNGYFWQVPYVLGYNCPDTFSGSGCPANTKAWTTATNANNCPSQQNRASNNFSLISGASSGTYTITILADSVNTNPGQISFNIYHDVGGGTDGNLGRYYNGWPVQLNSGNNNYYLGGISGALGQFNVCFSQQ